MHHPTRKLPIRARKETRDLVLSLRPEFQRKFALRSIVTSARSMGAHILHTTQKIVIIMKKTDWKKPISMPLRTMERNPITKNYFGQVSEKLEML
jgi:hypothetical protein